jgi:multicomponent Na+:H+ antiporter subunit A
MIFAVLSGILFALLLFLLGKPALRTTPFIPILLPLSLFVYFLNLIGNLPPAGSVLYHYPWVSSANVNLNFNLDGLSLLFCLLISGIGTLVFLYTSYYMKGHPYLVRFYAYLSLFMASMLGLVLSDNIITLFIFWELTSISSFFLIGFNNQDPASRKSALTALGITGFGGMSLLAFALLAFFETGTMSIHEMLTTNMVFLNGEFSLLLLVFLLVAAFTKSAQFPFHFWLPGAMKAPTPVSTYLHSATMVKAGIYLLLRFSPHYGQSDVFGIALIGVGGVTMLYAAFQTLFRTDLKAILAYSTITALGILVFLIGIGTTMAITAALVFIIVHALYKAALFLITGILDHQTGTRNITKLAGLGGIMLPTAIAGAVAAVSSAGIPPSLGFIGKDLVYESTLGSTANGVLHTGIAVVTNIIMVYAGFIVGVKPFIGKRPKELENTKSPSPLLWISPVLLACLSLLFGIFPGILQEPIITAAGKSVGITTMAPLKLWHGFNLVLLLSAITIGVGLALYFLWKPNNTKELFLGRFTAFSPISLAEGLNKLVAGFALWFTRLTQSGYLRYYVLTVITVITLLMGYHVFSGTGSFLNFRSSVQASFNDYIILAIMFGAILFTIFSRSRLSAVAGLGVVGYCMCFIFVFYSAPDLAMTQFTIDTLTVILFVLVLYRLPKYLKLSNTVARVRDGSMAIVFGAFITMIILEVKQMVPAKETSEFYTENAYVMAKGKNIVNVILVDFRGFDTMVEIIVLSIAAIGVFGLLKLHLRPSEK